MCSLFLGQCSLLKENKQPVKVKLSVHRNITFRSNSWNIYYISVVVNIKKTYWIFTSMQRAVIRDTIDIAYPKYEIFFKTGSQWE